jgi:hypothetical protein
VRIIALYILHRDGVPDEDRRRLYQHARLSLAEQDAVNALALLGARISRGPGDRDTRKKLRARPAPDEEYDLSRYKPLLRTVLEVRRGALARPARAAHAGRARRSTARAGSTRRSSRTSRTRRSRRRPRAAARRRRRRRRRCAPPRRTGTRARARRPRRTHASACSCSSRAG